MKKKPPRDTATLGSSEVSVATAESVSQVTSPSTPATPWFLSHAAVVLTIGSLSVSLLGAILQGVTCWTLGINFFDYAQPADFFMSFFRRPDGAFLVIFLLLFQLLVQLPSEWVHRNRARAIQLREETWWGRMAFHRQFFWLCVARRSDASSSKEPHPHRLGDDTDYPTRLSCMGASQPHP